MKILLKTILLLFVCIASISLGLAIGLSLRKGQPTKQKEKVETFTDTINYQAPEPVETLPLGTSAYAIPVYGGGAGGEPRCCDDILDTVVCGDSVVVELPNIQRHYADSTYEAWVSGPIDPRLDSVRVFSPTTIITKRERMPPKKWHIGPTIGYGYTPQGFQPYIGISITYSIISF